MTGDPARHTLQDRAACGPRSVLKDAALPTPLVRAHRFAQRSRCSIIQPRYVDENTTSEEHFERSDEYREQIE
jgi:hypothetical protein